AAFQVVEYRDFLGQHQENVRRAEFVGPIPVREARLGVADRFETKITDQPTGEGRQVRQVRYVILGAQTLDLRKRIIHLARLDDRTLLDHGQGVCAKTEDATRRQADDRIAS